MKLEWIKRGENLVAEVGQEVAYFLAWAPDGWRATVRHIVDGRWTPGYTHAPASLPECIKWCEEDYVRVAWINNSGQAPKQPSPKFPSNMAHEDWASRCTAWFGAFKVPDLSEWFEAALTRGYLSGVSDAESKQAEKEASMHRFIAMDAGRAQAPKQPSPEATEPQGFKCPECGGPFWGTTEWQRGPAEGNCHGWTNDGLRCRFSWIRSPEEDPKLGITNEAPPWFYAPGPPSDLERLETTMRLHHEWAAKNLADLRETLQMRVAGLDAPALKRRLGDLEARLEAQTRAHANTRQELDEFVKALDDRLVKEDILGIHPMMAAGREAREIKKRLEKLESRL